MNTRFDIPCLATLLAAIALGSTPCLADADPATVDCGATLISAWEDTRFQLGRFAEHGKLVATEDGRLFVLDRNRSTIQVYSINGILTWEFAARPPDNRFLRTDDMIRDRSGNFWTTDLEFVHRFTPDGVHVESIPVARCGGLAEVGDEIWAVQGETLVAVSPDPRTIVNLETIFPSDLPSRRFIICGSPDGCAFVASHYESRIAKLDKNGQLLEVWGGSGNGPGQMQRPTALQCDGLGHLIVGEMVSRSIQIFDMMGGYVCRWTPIDPRTQQAIIPGSLAATTDGTILIVPRSTRRVLAFQLGKQPGSGVVWPQVKRWLESREFTEPESLTLASPGYVR